MVRSVTEIFSEINSKKNKEERAQCLYAWGNKYWSIKHILRLTYDPRAQFRVGQGDVTYKECIYPDQYNMLHKEAKRLYIFLAGENGNPNLSQTKCENLFIQFLEGLDKEDAKTILYIVKNKDVPFKNINKELVDYTFPGLI